MKVPIDLICYDVITLGNRSGIAVWESSCTGILPELDWNALARYILSFVPDDLAEVLLCSIDEIAHMTFVLNDCDWNLAKEYALKAIEYLRFFNTVKVKIMDRYVFVPKPSRDLKIATISTLDIENYRIIGLFDGESVSFGYSVGDFTGKIYFDKFVRHIVDVMNNSFKIIVLDKNQILRVLQGCKQTSLVLLLQNCDVIELRNLVRKKLGIDIVPLEALQRALGMERRTELNKIYERFNWAKRMKKLEEFTGAAREYISDDLKALYNLYLALK